MPLILFMSVISLSTTARNAALQTIKEQKLPEHFLQIVEEFYLPVAIEIVSSLSADTPTFIGVQGSQGSGKSTCAEFMRILLAHQFDKKIVVMSIDDFYLTKAERVEMSKTVHPLFLTRGVPGTHDVAMIESVFSSARAGEDFEVPVFDKSIDDRAPQSCWQRVTEKTDVVVLEGWCVGIPPELDVKLTKPVNDLEKFEDSDAVWRSKVNDALKNSYAELYARFDKLIALQAPSFDRVFEWRLLQEEKMIARIKARGGDTSETQSPEQISRFIAHYQRLTQHGLETMPAQADYLITLNTDHSYNELKIRAS